MADLVVPPLGESITEAVIGRWLKQVGESVAEDEPVLDLETDKITVQLPAPEAGALTEQRVAEGETVRVGDVIGQIGAARAGAKAPAPPRQPAVETAASDRDIGRGPTRVAEPDDSVVPAVLAPVAHVAEVAHDDHNRLSPSERRARFEQATGAKNGRPARAAAPARAPAPAPVPSPEAVPVIGEEVVRMSPLRKRIAERLVEAQTESASLTTFNEVDMTAVMDLRKQLGDAFVKAHEVKLGFMSFFVRASVAALRKFPGVNAEVRGDAIVYKKRYDLGIAVSTERGLVVPVLRGCDHLSFAGIEQGIIDLATKARDSKLTLDDLTGGTFTITNGGIYGSMMSTPLLNFPQTGILGMHNIVKRPMVVGDTVSVRPMMYIALTYDHRVVDGREAVQFLVAVKDSIESPERLLLDV